jgi:hypothetical protein
MSLHPPAKAGGFTDFNHNIKLLVGKKLIIKYTFQVLRGTPINSADMKAYQSKNLII